VSSDVVATSLILLSAVLHAISSSVFRLDGDRLVRMGAGSFVTLAIMVPVAFYVPFPAPEVWPVLFASLSVLIIFQLTGIKSLEYGTLSYVYPISRGTGPVFVVVISLLYLNQEVGFAAILGVSFVALGVLELATRGYKEAAERRHLILATSLSLVNGLCIGTYTLIDSGGVRMVENPFSYIAWLFIMFSTAFLIIPAILRGRRLIPLMRQESRIAVIGAFIGVASYTTALMALRLGSAVEIAALRETSIMFAVLIGYLFLGEGIGTRRLIAVTLIATGAIVIKAF
jgi:drug/metabolite transporter (DMT)-like permease